MTSFRAQGSVFIDALDYYAAAVPGGVAAVAGRLGDESASRYCRSRFAADQWYALEPIVPMTAAASALLGCSPGALASDCARWSAERKMRGIYRLVLRVARPEWLAPRLPQASLRFFDFGRAEVQKLGSRHYRAWQRDIPASVADWLCSCVVAVAPLVLERCGARAVACAAGDRQTRGALVDLTYELRWS